MEIWFTVFFVVLGCLTFLITIERICRCFEECARAKAYTEILSGSEAKSQKMTKNDEK